MSLQTQTIKQIRGLMQDPKWPALEEALGVYLRENFLETSVKRANEFETVWFVAHNEGGKFHLTNFFNNLEHDALNLD